MNHWYARIAVVVVIAAVCGSLRAAPATSQVAVKDLAAASALNDRPDQWFGTNEATQFLDSIVAAQLPNGGWDKGYFSADAAVHAGKEWKGHGTIDNGFTYTELRLLARAYNLTRRQVLLDAFNKGLDFLFTAQYPNGGFPQRYPLSADYGKAITLNDDAMVNVLWLMKDIADQKPSFAFVDADRRSNAKRSLDNGIECLLKLQIMQSGRPTAWAQQYDPQSLEPCKARAYELPGITPDESVGVLELLMSLETPSIETRGAIRTAIQWLRESRITGIRIAKRPDPSLPRGNDITVVPDPNATDVMWARCYDIETNKPFFCGRDGIKKWSLNEIEAERRAGYFWYGTWPVEVLNEYPKWESRLPRE